MHGDHIGHKADDGQTHKAEDANKFKSRSQRRIHGGESRREADGGAHDAHNSGGQRRDNLVHKAEQGAHETGDILAGAVDLIVGAVGDHGENDVAGDAGEALETDPENKEGYCEEGPSGEPVISGEAQGGGIRHIEEEAQKHTADQGAIGPEHHGLLLAQPCSDPASAKENE